MIDLLARVDATYLKSEVRKIPLAGAMESIRGLKSPRRLASFLVAYYGFDLLETTSIRQALFSLFSLKTLNELCKKAGLPQAGFAYDAALILSTASWNYTSSLPTEISLSLKKIFGETIPDEFLPAEPLAKPPTIEEIYSEALTPLFDYQQEMSKAIAIHFSIPGQRAMLQMPTGSGKTRSVMHAVVGWLSSHSRTENSSNLILWMAHSEELCEQAIATFKQSWAAYGEGGVRLYRLWGTHKVPEDTLSSGLLVASLQKLHSLRTKSDHTFLRVAEDIGIVIFDEAHKALAPTYKSLIADLMKGHDKTLLGLSATPGRAVLEAVENKRLAKLFGNKLIHPQFADNDPLKALRGMGVLARIKRQVIRNPNDYVLTSSEERFVADFFEFPKSFLERLGQDEQRNVLVVKAILQQVRRKRQCIVFACSVEQAKLLSAMLVLEGISSCSVSSDMRHTSRVRAIEGFRTRKFDVIVNYGILTTGFDAPNVGAVIIARPTASIVLYSQMIGRGLRGPRVGGNLECNVVDVVDNIAGFGTEAEVYSYFSDYWA